MVIESAINPKIKEFTTILSQYTGDILSTSKVKLFEDYHMFTYDIWIEAFKKVNLETLSKESGSNKYNIKDVIYEYYRKKETLIISKIQHPVDNEFIMKYDEMVQNLISNFMKDLLLEYQNVNEFHNNEEKMIYTQLKIQFSQ